MPEVIVKLSQEISNIAKSRIKDIGEVTRRTKIIAINAMIEASRIGSAGKGFSVVANEVHSISDKISEITMDLEENLASRVKQLDYHGRDLITQIRGDRLVDLSVNLIDIIDRNLYERSCDVRWWATESALITAVAHPDADKASMASQRIRVILKSYTVYADIWLMDLSGKVIAHGMRDKYPSVLNTQVGQEKWFQEALRCQTGSDYTVADIEQNKSLGQLVATYATVVREGGEENGRPLGVLGVFFDWGKQSATVVNGVRIPEKERAFTRCLILNKSFRVIASSNQQGNPEERLSLETNGRDRGNYTDSRGRVIGFAQTIGYETYPGLGWYGVVVQDLSRGGG